jgi:hypothetical protein
LLQIPIVEAADAAEVKTTLAGGMQMAQLLVDTRTIQFSIFHSFVAEWEYTS